MKRSLLTVLAIVSACTTPALADEFEGAASIGASYSNIHGQQAKFNEYRTLGDGAQGSLEMNYRADSGYYLEGATDFNVTDSSKANDVNLNIKTGLQDVFKGSIFYNEIPHNFTFGAKTFQTGIGSNTLTYTGSNATRTNADFTNSFDYSIRRYNYGAEAEVSLKSPFFFLARVERNETDGLMPMTVRGGSGGAIELPAPIEYTTDTVYLQSGYRSSNLIATLDGTLVSFRNENGIFTSRHPLANTAYTNIAYLPQNNQYYKLGSSVMYKIPLFSSTLMARASHSYLDSDFNTKETITTQFGATPIALGSLWQGKVQESSIGVSITSNPIKKLDTKIYYNYFNRNNNSDTGFIYGSTGSAPAENYYTKVFNFHKNNAGIDLGYKLPVKTKLNVGYDFSDTDRTLTYRSRLGSALSDSPETVDHTVYVQIKNDLLDWMSAKIKYKRLIRKSDFDYRDTAASAGISSIARADFKPEGTADKIQDSITTGVHFDILDSLGVGLDYSYKRNNYHHTTLGVTSDNSNQFYLDVTYAKAFAKLNAYADLELVNKDSYNNSNNTTTYWSSKRKDVNYALGLDGEFEIIKDKINFATGYRYEKADGENDLTSNASTPIDINYLDDYIKHSLNAKLSYKFNKSMTVDLGYIYEHLNYTDDAYSNYSYVTGYSNVAGTAYPYQTGAYADPNYSANVFYTKLNFKF